MSKDRQTCKEKKSIMRSPLKNRLSDRHQRYFFIMVATREKRIGQPPQVTRPGAQELLQEPIMAGHEIVVLWLQKLRFLKQPSNLWCAAKKISV